MQSKVLRRLWLVLAASTIAASLFLAGCDGDDGDDGRPGRDAGRGPIQVSDLTPEQQADLNVNGEILSVSNDARPVVRFRLTDNDGDPIIGLGQRNAAGTQLQNLRFSLAKLVPGTSGAPSQWVNYIVTSAPSTATPPAATTGSRPTTDREGTLVDNGDGTYTYTFARDITQTAAQVAALTDSGNNRKADLGDVSYQPNLTHRLVMAYSGNIVNVTPNLPIENPFNVVYDYIPASERKVEAGDAQREIVLTQSCNECHGSIREHGYAVDTRFCAICHTNQRAYGQPIVNPDANGVYPAGQQTAVSRFGTAPNQYTEVMGDFTMLIHKIHHGAPLPNEPETGLFRTNYNYAGLEFDELGYTQSSALCRKCHRENANAPQANNWFNAPNRKGCGSCHDNINWITGANHPGGASADGTCNTESCHPPLRIRNNHAQDIASPLNPDINPELTNFRYEIQSATVDQTTNDLTIRFRILSSKGSDPFTAVTFVPSDPGVTNPLTGFTGSPSFLLAYALPQIGFQNRTTAMPADFNNRGNGQAQPATISITQLLTGARGTLSGPTNGYYTATVPSARAFPRGAKLRSVALQGYFTQPAGGSLTEESGRHTISVIKTVDADTPRRTVVDPAKCGKCHEYFEAHGGNRVYETQVCVTCHNPNLTTSGRTVPDASLSTYAFTPMEQEILIPYFGNPPNFSTTNAALNFPEFTNNFKELIHGIHAGASRTDPLFDARYSVRQGETIITLIDASPFQFPNMLANCEACHLAAATGNSRHSYSADLPANVLPTTNVTLNATTPVTPASITAARGTVPNPQDLVIPAVTGACISCHDTPEAVAHMQANGAQLGDINDAEWTSNSDVGTPRFQMNPAAEQCRLCHGAGKVADVVKEHDTNVDADDDDL